MSVKFFKLIFLVTFVKALPVEYPELSENYFEGDMILTPEQVEELFTLSKSGFINEKYRWKDGVVPYQLLLKDFDLVQVSKIRKAMKTLESLTCLKFIQYNPSLHKNFVKFHPSNGGCSSSVGRQGGRQTINLYSGCFNGIFTLCHEILHAVGFYHMQSAAERDDFVKILWENITKGHEHNFSKYAKNVVTNFGTLYDYDSVMHYSSEAFAKPGTKTIIPLQELNDGVKMGQRTHLSEGDIKRINAMYKCKM